MNRFLSGLLPKADAPANDDDDDDDEDDANDDAKGDTNALRVARPSMGPIE